MSLGTRATSTRQSPPIASGDSVLNPNWPRLIRTAAITLEDQGKLEEAVAAYRHAIDIKPDLAYSNLGNALEDEGKHDEAIAAYRHAIDIQPDYAEALLNLLFSLHHDDKSTAEQLFTAHREWNERYGRPMLRPIAYANDHGKVGG